VRRNNSDKKALDARNRRFTLRELTNFDLHYVFLAAFDLLTSWPDHWFTDLERISTQEEFYRQQPDKTYKRRSFPYSFQKAFPQESWPWLWQALRDFVQLSSNQEKLRWLPYLKPKRPVLATVSLAKAVSSSPNQPEQSSSYPNLSLAEAANRLGFSKGALKKPFASGLLCHTAKPNRKTKWRFPA
jgi:hypothetical protein